MLKINYQSHPKSTKIEAFEQKECIYIYIYIYIYISQTQDPSDNSSKLKKKVRLQISPRAFFIFLIITNRQLRISYIFGF